MKKQTWKDERASDIQVWLSLVVVASATNTVKIITLVECSGCRVNHPHVIYQHTTNM